MNTATRIALVDAYEFLAQGSSYWTKWAMRIYGDTPDEVFAACLVGAVDLCAPEEALEVIVSKLPAGPWDDECGDIEQIAAFNDDPHTTYEDVLLVAKRAAFEEDTDVD